MQQGPVITMSYDEYDKLTELFEKMKTRTFWPTVDQIDIFEQNPAKWITFVCYLYEKGKAPKNQEEKYSKKNLCHFIGKYLELTD